MILDRLDVLQLRDAAIEYLPLAQQARDIAKKNYCTHEQYFHSLFFAAMRTRALATASAAEIVAADVLYVIALWAGFDHKSTERQAELELNESELEMLMIGEIARTADKLAHVTGRTFRIELPAKSKSNQIKSGANWKDEARAIADELYDIDTAANCRDSLGGYSDRVMGVMQKRGIDGVQGRITYSTTIKRDALQGAKWWRTNNKGTKAKAI